MKLGAIVPRNKLMVPQDLTTVWEFVSGYF